MNSDIVFGEADPPALEGFLFEDGHSFLIPISSLFQDPCYPAIRGCLPSP